MFTQLQPKGSVMQPAAAAIWHLGSLTGIEKKKKIRELKNYVRLTTKTKSRISHISPNTEGISNERSLVAEDGAYLHCMHTAQKWKVKQLLANEWNECNTMKLSEKHTHTAKISTVCPYLTSSFVTYSYLHLQRLPQLIHTVGLRTLG